MSIAKRAMVTLVRESKGWTQQQLADAAGTTQAWVSKVESGIVDAKGDGLTKLATALECPESLLTDDTTLLGLETTCLHNRNRSSKITAKARKQILARSLLTRISVEGVLSGVDLDTDGHLVRMDIDEGQSPAEIAKAIRMLWRVPPGPIVDLTRLLEAAGIIIIERFFGTNAQDATSTWPPDQTRPPIMVVNIGVAPDRARFTKAHELGHLVMHSLPSEAMEREADEFAAEFLAPADDLGDELAGLTTREMPRLIELKSRWGMSIAALIRRARDLEIISDRQYREFQIKLSKLGWRTREPHTMEPEHPRTMERLIDLHLHDHNYSLGEIAKVAGMNRDTFTKVYYPGHEAPRRTLRVIAGEGAP